MKQFLEKVYFPLALVFAAVALLLAIDFVLPQTVNESMLDHYDTDDEAAKESNTLVDGVTYYIVTSTGNFKIDNASGEQFTKGSRLTQFRSRIFRATTHFSLQETPDQRYEVLTGPFRFFPMIPLILLLPLVFAFIPKESLLSVAGRNGSLILAIAALSLCFVG